MSGSDDEYTIENLMDEIKGERSATFDEITELREMIDDLPEDESFDYDALRDFLEEELRGYESIRRGINDIRGDIEAHIGRSGYTIPRRGALLLGAGLLGGVAGSQLANEPTPYEIESDDKILQIAQAYNSSDEEFLNQIGNELDQAVRERRDREGEDTELTLIYEKSGFFEQHLEGQPNRMMLEYKGRTVMEKPLKGLYDEAVKEARSQV